jgi:hypothetical protein
LVSVVSQAPIAACLPNPIPEQEEFRMTAHEIKRPGVS